MKKMPLLYENIVNHKNHQQNISCFSLIGSASNKFHLKLKESLLEINQIITKN